MLGTGLQRVVPLRDQSGETLRTTYRNNWLRSYGRPRILLVDQQRTLCTDIFSEKVDSDGTRLEVTLEAPWRNGKTERAGTRSHKTVPKHRRARILKRTSNRGELTLERSMTVRRLALQASLAVDHKRRWKRLLHHAAKHYQGELHVGQPFRLWRRGANEAKKPTTRRAQFKLPTVVPRSSVHDLRCDNFTRTMRRPMNTSRNT